VPVYPARKLMRIMLEEGGARHFLACRLLRHQVATAFMTKFVAIADPSATKGAKSPVESRHDLAGATGSTKKMVGLDGFMAVRAMGTEKVVARLDNG